MKKLITLLTACSISISAFMPISVLADDYYNASSELNQIKTYMNNGMYVEAMRDCENTLAWHTLSPEDIAIFNDLKTEAEQKYYDYINGTSSYYNPANEIKQIQSYIAKGLYLEAIQDCKNTLAWHVIAPTDMLVLRDLKYEAQTKYNNYINYINQFAYYRHNGWGMVFKYYSDVTPKSYGDEYDYDQYIHLPSSGANLEIHSYDAGITYDWGSATSAKEAISKQVAFWKELSKDDGYGYGIGFDVLSENDTTVGDFKARQATFRASLYKNRYWTSADYVLVKLIAFKYGKYIYVIEARENAYNWSQAFWDEIELVRTSIYFE